jgi:hypothetical protein
MHLLLEELRRYIQKYIWREIKMKCHTIISVSPEVRKHIASMIKKKFNFSEWVERRYCDEIMDKKTFLENKISEAKFNINSYEKELAEVKEAEEKMFKRLTNEQIAELSLSNNILRKEPQLFEGRLGVWKNRFGMVSQRDYEFLLKKVQEANNELTKRK